MVDRGSGSSIIDNSSDRRADHSAAFCVRLRRRPFARQSCRLPPLYSPPPASGHVKSLRAGRGRRAGTASPRKRERFCCALLRGAFRLAPSQEGAWGAGRRIRAQGPAGRVEAPTGAPRTASCRPRARAQETGAALSQSSRLVSAPGGGRKALRPMTRRPAFRDFHPVCGRLRMQPAAGRGAGGREPRDARVRACEARARAPPPSQRAERPAARLPQGDEVRRG